MRIKPLSSAVANQIAAGEVIENPASVVKELLENSSDAKASVVHIDIGFGGLNQIKVSDNGLGIVADDLPLAVAPHATSKLTKLEDLSHLSSMGFRGEALASIASISHFSIHSKPQDQEHAMMLQINEEGVTLSSCARNQGTTVDVRDLFFNAPVRRRFLRSERSEYLAIEHVVKRFALSRPSLFLVLKHNGKTTLELTAAHCEQTERLRIQKILGKAFIENANFLEVEHGGMKLHGWVSNDAYQRSQTDKQWFYLNHRMVKDKLMLHAFKQAYENRLYPGRHPSCLLYFTIPTFEVDINVHPTKHEVRFQQPRLVHDFIHKCISEALNFSPVERSEMEEPEPSTSSLGLFSDIDLVGQTHPTSKLVLRERQVEVQPWTTLNSQFGLIHHRGFSYLFDILKVNEERTLFLLKNENRPLACRPLLIPLRETILNTHHLLNNFKWLSEFGINCEPGNEQLLIRTIPLILPQLNIKHLIRCCSEQEYTEEEFLSLLASSQITEMDILSIENRNLLHDYIIQHLDENDSPQWCVPLHRERCAEIMYG